MKYSGSQWIDFSVKQSISDEVQTTAINVGTWDANWHLISFGMYPTPTTSQPYQHTIWISKDGGAKQLATIEFPSVPAVGDLYVGEYLNTGTIEYGAYYIDQMSVYPWTFSPGDLTTFYNSGNGRSFPFTVYGY
jgi:hypothetical protein